MTSPICRAIQGAWVEFTIDFVLIILKGLKCHTSGCKLLMDSHTFSTCSALFVQTPSPH